MSGSTPELAVEDLGFAKETVSEMSLDHARRLEAALSAEEDLAVGAILPLLWHWAFFTPTVPTTQLGRDGHPQMSAQGLSSDSTRRMFAGGRVVAHGPLRIGRSATRRSRVASGERKSGRSGGLLIVTVVHEIEQGDDIVLVEEQDIVYRSNGSVRGGVLPLSGPAIPATTPGWIETITVDAVTLFRFSAVTFNSHRIHYDLPYANECEGYPGLVVHGPLTALLLLGSARRRGVSGSCFSFRATAPLFAETPFSLVGELSSDGAQLRAVRNDSSTAMTARLT